MLSANTRARVRIHTRAAKYDETDERENRHKRKEEKKKEQICSAVRTRLHSKMEKERCVLLNLFLLSLFIYCDYCAENCGMYRADVQREL